MVSFFSIQSTCTKWAHGVSQDSACGPILLSMYTAAIIRIAHSFKVSIKFYCYADDLQLYIHCQTQDSAAAIVRMLTCIKAINKWMDSKLLKMNQEKSSSSW